MEVIVARIAPDMAVPVVPHCFVCGTTALQAELRMRRFVVLAHWIESFICRRCWDIPTDEPREGEWDDPPSVAAGIPILTGPPCADRDDCEGCHGCDDDEPGEPGESMKAQS